MSRPKCPNHTVEMLPTDEKRIWICPISDAKFETDSDTQDKVVKFDKFGRPLHKWQITQADGGTGG